MQALKFERLRITRPNMTKTLFLIEIIYIVLGTEVYESFYVINIPISFQESSDEIYKKL